jgi:formylmethanofuran dehydrogenase subunit E
MEKFSFVVCKSCGEILDEKDLIYYNTEKELCNYCLEAEKHEMPNSASIEYKGGK